MYKSWNSLEIKLNRDINHLCLLNNFHCSIFSNYIITFAVLFKYQIKKNFFLKTLLLYIFLWFIHQRSLVKANLQNVHNVHLLYLSLPNNNSSKRGLTYFLHHYIWFSLYRNCRPWDFNVHNKVWFGASHQRISNRAHLIFLECLITILPPSPWTVPDLRVCTTWAFQSWHYNLFMSYDTKTLRNTSSSYHLSI